MTLTNIIEDYTIPENANLKSITSISIIHIKFEYNRKKKSQTSLQNKHPPIERFYCTKVTTKGEKLYSVDAT